ncbi:MAG TPA: MarR family transcriptional regulator [Propionibacteriaceae bacterium]|nr:MarR family transcriptional regulator [Propionibacteriaceae bacterium]
MNEPELTTDQGLAQALRASVMRLGRRLRQVRADSLDLQSNQLSVMAALLNEGDMLMGALAARERMQPPSMTRIVNGLEERGYVARRPDPSDRRQCLVTVTEAGREIILANRQRRDEWLTVRIAELEPAERAVLQQAVAILDRVNHE